MAFWEGHQGNASGEIAQDSDNLLFIVDENEYEALKTALATDKPGEPLSAHDIERLAFTLSDYCMAHAAEDDDLENAGQEIHLLFRCRRALPDSKPVQDAFYETVLMYIDEAGNRADFESMEDCLSKLVALLNQDPNNRMLARVCANATVLALVNYLDCEEEAKKKTLFFSRKKKTPYGRALDKHATLETLAAPYLSGDPVMPAMLARAQCVLIRDDIHEGRADACENRLGKLRLFLDECSDNALVAGEYFLALYYCFTNALTEQPQKAKDFLPEMEGVARRYNVGYDALAEDMPDYHFPGYSPGNIDNRFISALTEISVNAAKNHDADGIRTAYRRLTGMTFSPAREEDYRSAEGALLSHLALVLGENGEFARAEETLEQLRRLIDSAKPSWRSTTLTDSLSDTLYNLVTDYVETDAAGYRERIDALVSELKELAESADEVTPHIRYASALYNIYVNDVDGSPRRKEFLERAYDWVLEHGVGESVITGIASAEAISVAGAGKTADIDAAKYHRDRVRALVSGEYYDYGRIAGMHTQSAVADFNLLVVASDAGDMALAREMFDSLVQAATTHPENKETLIRLAKGGANLVTDYGEAGDIGGAEAVFRAMFPPALPYADNPEIANRLVNAAFNLSIDLVNTGQYRRVALIYDAIKHTEPDGDAAGRLEKIRAMTGRNGSRS